VKAVLSSSEACKLLEEFMEKLSRTARRLLSRGLREAAKRGDVAALYHYSTMIGTREYMDAPNPPFPGVFKSTSCLSRVELPKPPRESGTDALEAIRRRRSRRSFQPKPIRLVELSTVLAYSVGITGYEYDWPLRAYPSAGGLQPVEAYIVAGSVEGIKPGLYHYDPRSHSLCLLREGDLRQALAEACLEQWFIADAPASIILTAYYARTASRYCARGYRYVLLDTGTAAENLYIVCEALGLATVFVGAFRDEELCQLLGLDCYNEFPVAVMPIGYPA